jgi:hypothetical protein
MLRNSGVADDFERWITNMQPGRRRDMLAMPVRVYL